MGYVLHLFGLQPLKWSLVMMFRSLGRKNICKFKSSLAKSGGDGNPNMRKSSWMLSLGIRVKINDTVDGRNPAPPGMYKTL